MLEMAEGKNPFTKMSIERIMKALIQFPPPKLSEKNEWSPQVSSQQWQKRRWNLV